MNYAGTTYYLAYDQVGSLRAVTDATGNIVKELSYDSFGNILDDSNPSMSLPFAFAGGLYDSDTGLIRFGYRDYDSLTGKWTAKDPIGFDGGDTSLYGYVLGDPVNFVDPTGLRPSLQEILDFLNRSREGADRIENIRELREFLEDQSNAQEAADVASMLCPIPFGLGCGMDRIRETIDLLENRENSAECQECRRACGVEACTMVCE